MATLFISDLHLDPSRPAIIDGFLDWLNRQAGSAEAVYILGDLFEAWIGDDDPEPLWQQVIRTISTCTWAGTPVRFMHGNRDFLIGEDFQRESGCQLISDPTVIELYGRRTLLMHGDLLCSDDTEYQQLRTRVRSPDWQQTVLKRPVEERLALACSAREQSKHSVLGKSFDILDVNQETVSAYMERYQVDLLIHGHTHRPGVYPVELSEGSGTRIVLGDWYKQGSLLRADADTLDLQTLESL